MMVKVAIRLKDGHDLIGEDVANKFNEFKQINNQEVVCSYELNGAQYTIFTQNDVYWQCSQRVIGETIYVEFDEMTDEHHMKVMELVDMYLDHDSLRDGVMSLHESASTFEA